MSKPVPDCGCGQSRFRGRWIAIALFASVFGPGCAPKESPKGGRAVEARQKEQMELTHEQTLEWIGKNRAWRHARKTKPIWARPITMEEIGKEFQTADRAIETAREGAWLCVGVAGEPWFQSEAKINAKYDRAESVTKTFDFDDEPHEYYVYNPKENVRNWVAQVEAPEIGGFSIRPGYDRNTELHSPAGGYVVKGDVDDPYADDPDDVWLVQQSLFDSTYELIEPE